MRSRDSLSGRCEELSLLAPPSPSYHNLGNPVRFKEALQEMTLVRWRREYARGHLVPFYLMARGGPGGPAPKVSG